MKYDFKLTSVKKYHFNFISELYSYYNQIIFKKTCQILNIYFLLDYFDHKQIILLENLKIYSKINLNKNYIKNIFYIIRNNKK